MDDIGEWLPQAMQRAIAEDKARCKCGKAKRLSKKGKLMPCVSCHKARGRKSRHGLTHEEQDALLASQGGRCAACRDVLSVETAHGSHLDHNHETGKVRGFLCKNCNVALGFAKDSPERLRNLIDYVLADGWCRGPTTLCSTTRMRFSSWSNWLSCSSSIESTCSSGAPSKRRSASR